jgi:hypothetical protein
MNNLLPGHLFKGRNKWWLLIIASIIFIAYQIDNIPRTDEEYLGEQVYWLMHKGKVSSELGYHNLGYDIYQSIYHKLFVYSGYAFCTIFGWSLLTLHTVSFLYFLLFLAVFYFYCRSRYGSTTNYLFFAAVILLPFNQDLLYAVGSFRPEVMLMALGFAAYALLEKYLKAGKPSTLTLSAFCAGLCMFAHLNGVIFIIAGCLLLLIKKKWKAAITYSAIAIIAFFPYFIDILYNADLAYFWHQFTHDPVLHSSETHWYSFLLKIVNEQSRFLFTEKQIMLTASLVATLTLSYKRLKQTHATLLLYTLILILSLAIVCPSKSTKYMVIYLPFLYIILVEGWQYIEASGIGSKLYTMRILLAASMLISLFYSGRQITTNVVNLRSGGIVAEHKALANKIRENHKTISLLAPRLMIFNELGKFNRLQDIEMIATENFIAYLNSSDINYVIFSEEDRKYFHLDQLLQEKDSPLIRKDSTAHYLLTEVRKR